MDGASCTIGVSFDPTVGGARTCTLAITEREADVFTLKTGNRAKIPSLRLEELQRICVLATSYNSVTH
jgi:hypothetical protein